MFFAEISATIFSICGLSLGEVCTCCALDFYEIGRQNNTPATIKSETIRFTELVSTFEPRLRDSLKGGAIIGA